MKGKVFLVETKDKTAMKTKVKDEEMTSTRSVLLKMIDSAATIQV